MYSLWDVLTVRCAGVDVLTGMFGCGWTDWDVWVYWLWDVRVWMYWLWDVSVWIYSLWDVRVWMYHKAPVDRKPITNAAKAIAMTAPESSPSTTVTWLLHSVSVLPPCRLPLLPDTAKKQQYQTNSGDTHRHSDTFTDSNTIIDRATVTDTPHSSGDDQL